MNIMQMTDIIGITTICIQTPMQMPTQIKAFIQTFRMLHMERKTADAMMA
nr:hypothetical protein P5627_10295 [Bacillus safensis]